MPTAIWALQLRMYLTTEDVFTNRNSGVIHGGSGDRWWVGAGKNAPSYR